MGIYRAILLFVLAALLSSCAIRQEPEYSAPAVSETAETLPTEAPHSAFYLPGYSIEQILVYFEEVALNVEYSDGTGAVDCVKKWLTPMTCRIYGVPTDADLAVMNALFAQLNGINGFPGIRMAEEDTQENVSIYFLDPEEFRESFSYAVNGEDAYGTAQYWYDTETNELHTARIGYRTDMDQSVRNSVLVEEIINILGISDTELRSDSVTYQFSNENTVLSKVDLLILKLIYEPSVRCGSDADSCFAKIQELYY